MLIMATGQSKQQQTKPHQTLMTATTDVHSHKLWQSSGRIRTKTKGKTQKAKNQT
jgi:hypothetical protein